MKPRQQIVLLPGLRFLGKKCFPSLFILRTLLLKQLVIHGSSQALDLFNGVLTSDWLHIRQRLTATEVSQEQLKALE
jgi:hypothetical protein